MNKRISIKDIESPEGLSKHPKGTVFVLDDHEKEMKIPESLKDKGKENRSDGRGL